MLSLLEQTDATTTKSYATSCVHATQLVALHLLPLLLAMTSNLNKRPTQCCFRVCLTAGTSTNNDNNNNNEALPVLQMRRRPAVRHPRHHVLPCNRTPLHFQFACSVQHLRVKAPENDPKHRLDLHHRRARSAISEEIRSRVVEPLPINSSVAAASPLKKKKKAARRFKTDLFCCMHVRNEW